jgi:hypothetical protein
MGKNSNILVIKNTENDNNFIRWPCKSCTYLVAMFAFEELHFTETLPIVRSFALGSGVELLRSHLQYFRSSVQTPPEAGKT